MSYMAINLRSVAAKEHKNGNTEVARIIEAAADEIDRLEKRIETMTNLALSYHKVGEVSPIQHTAKIIGENDNPNASLSGE